MTADRRRMPPGTFGKRCGAKHGGVGKDRRRQLRWLAAALRGMMANRVIFCIRPSIQSYRSGRLVGFEVNKGGVPLFCVFSPL